MRRKRKGMGQNLRKGLALLCLGGMLLAFTGCRNQEKERQELRLQGITQLEAGDYDKALEYLKQGIQTGDAQAMESLLRNQAAVYEKKLDFAGALSVLEQYAAAYGATPEIQKEIDFLKTR